MNEEDIKKIIVESARNLEVPKGLEPEQMQWALKQEKKRRNRKVIKKTAVAACLCLCFGLAGTAWHSTSLKDQKTIQQDVASPEDGKNELEAAMTENGKNEQEAEQPIQNLGKIYKLAKSYGEVRRVLKKGGVLQRNSYAYYDMGGIPAMKLEKAAEESVSEDSTYGTNDSADNSYSTTNLQVDGVDESDIIKTDGAYLYVARDQKIKILSLNQGRPKLAAEIEPEGFSEEDWICDLYVADGKLILVAESTETELWQVKTKVLSYDISNPERPSYLDKTEQDGGYQTSRKVDDRLYLFTTNFLSYEEGQEKNEGTDDLWIPCVDGQKISADSIYLPKRGNSSLTMSCIELGGQHDVLDAKLLVNDGANYYVTKDSIYIYNTVYNFSAKDVTEKTQIARFALTESGKIQAVAGKTVRGSIMDTFAINEQDGYLRVLTSITSAKIWENRVYVLDLSLEVQGKLTGLAKGEQIYAARFLGKTGYFVTYRNTDPLFAVDLSDPKEPQIIGELKLTGFSDYLHFWDDGHLLGIGYETDEKTGEFLGVKLAMFTIYNPADIQVEGAWVISEADSSPATVDYKTVLVDDKKNLIAFLTESYRSEEAMNYRVFSYQDGKFQEQLNYKLGEDAWAYDYRSFYAGDVLYLSNQEMTVAFDLKNQFQKLGKANY